MTEQKIKELEVLEKKYDVDAIILFKLLASKDTDNIYFKLNDNRIIALQMDFDVALDLNNTCIKAGNYDISYPLNSYGILWSLNKEQLLGGKKNEK